MESVQQIDLRSGLLFRTLKVKDGIDESFRNPHRHSFYELVWVEKGSGLHRIDFKDLPLVNNRLYVIRPGQVHQWSDNCFSGRMILFSDAILDSFYRNQIISASDFQLPNTESSYVDLNPQLADKLRNLSDLMLIEFEGERDWNMIRPLLTAFLYEVVRLQKKARVQSEPPYVKRMMSLQKHIEDSFISERKTEFYAEKLNITSKRLNEVTRQVFGKTVTQLLHERLMLEAMRELSYSEDSVKAIGFRLGFKEPTYFGRFFFKNSGATPKQFRQSVKR